VFAQTNARLRAGQIEFAVFMILAVQPVRRAPTSKLFAPAQMVKTCAGFTGLVPRWRPLWVSFELPEKSSTELCR
jgi:hypothetical protein